MKLITFTLYISVVYGGVPRSGPPPVPKPAELAKTARDILHKTEWVALATTSRQPSIRGYPFASLQSVSDGPDSNSTGIPYFYISELGDASKDITDDNRCTIMASLATTDYCKEKNYHPLSHRCSRIFLTGKMIKVENTTSEHDFAKNALFAKYPSMKQWPKDHGFFVAKLSLEQVTVVAPFYVSNVPVAEYLSVQNETPHE